MWKAAFIFILNQLAQVSPEKLRTWAKELEDKDPNRTGIDDVGAYVLYWIADIRDSIGK